MSDQQSTPAVRESAEQRDKRIKSAVEAARKLSANPSIEKQMAVSLIDKAQSLRLEREENTKQTGANRDMLRGMATQGLLTAEQVTAVNAIYPPHKRGENGGADTAGASTPPAQAPAGAASHS